MIRAMVSATVSLVGLAAAASPGSHAAPVMHRVPEGPYVELWTSGELFHPGDRVHVWVRPAEDAHVMVFRVDTDGRVRVLYPRYPWHDNFIAGGERVEVWNPSDGDDSYAFVVDDDPGTGYLFAVASRVPFEFDAFALGDHWDYRHIAYYGRVTGDPYVTLTHLVDQMVPATAYDAYSYDVSPYHVGQRYDYPRFLCYDCHAYMPYRSWNPYQHACVKFRIEIHEAPYYYPARVYAETRVAYTRPRTVDPRFVFKDRGPEEPAVTRVEQQPSDPSIRRGPTGATANDVGGVGSVPTPGRRPTVSDEPATRREVEARPTTANLLRLMPSSRQRGGDPVTRLIPRLERRDPNKKVDQRSRDSIPVRQIPSPARVPVERPTTPPGRTKVRPRPVKPDTGGTGEPHH
ncbi:MAG: hypothetical protein AMS18_01065 [Gemmatimonas sp. SG8_17]|nr:MAG: hypothetical protein AMS18_01065 [Gemmatimonas sp. SG8_17]